MGSLQGGKTFLPLYIGDTNSYILFLILPSKSLLDKEITSIKKKYYVENGGQIMKIYKVANMFEDEGRDPLEQIEERSNFESQKELSDIERGKGGNTHTSEVISDITPSFQERLGTYWIANGSVGWFRYKDGVVYEVQVKPIGLGNYENLYLQSKKAQQEPQEATGELPM